MGLFDAKVCKHCGAKIGMVGKTKLTDGNYLCSKCTKGTPYYINLSNNSYEEFIELLNYMDYSKKELSKIFKENHSFSSLHLDTAHGLFYIEQAYTKQQVYLKFENIVSYNLEFIPEELKTSLLTGDKVTGKIIFKLEMEKPVFFYENAIEDLVKAKAKTLFGKLESFQNPKGMDEFLHYFSDAFTSALVNKIKKD